MHDRDLWQHLGNPKRIATRSIVAACQVGQHTGGRGIKKLAARWNITFTDHLDRRVHEVQQCMRRIVEHMVRYLVHDLLPFRAIKLEFTIGALLLHLPQFKIQLLGRVGVIEVQGRAEPAFHHPSLAVSIDLPLVDVAAAL